MMKIHTSVLAAKVAAVNAANAEAIRLFPVLSAVFAPLVGCKIEKVDGTLLQSVKKLVPELPNTGPLSVFRHSSDYSLAYTVKTCESSPSNHTDCQIANYHEVNVYLGEMRGGILLKLRLAPEGLRTDWTESEVIEARKIAEAAKQAARDAEGKIYPFGLFDR